MSGLMQQIEPENKKLYDASRMPLYAKQTLAGNILHLHLQQGKLSLGQAAEIKPLIESEDPESIMLGIAVMESLTSEVLTT